MILILGGTTEGRLAVEVLEEAGKPFFYSTKRDEQEIGLHHGRRLTGGLDEEQMVDFCMAQGIGLLVDAAHPFAEQLHRTVQHTARVLQLPVVRLERGYPVPEGGVIEWCDSLEEAVQRLQAAKVQRVLALTGVQTLERLRPLWQGSATCFVRILNRDSSREVARRSGFPPECLCYYEGEGHDEALMQRLHPEVILLKESGTSGGFGPKVEAAWRAGIRVMAIRRPALPASFVTVNGPHGLRRAVERWLPAFFDLHSGLTTGTCATAAALAAARRWLGQRVSEVAVQLPNGESISVEVSSEEGPWGATVYKDAGDDPDITHGAAICARFERAEGEASDYEIEVFGGPGVGRVTLPGLGLEVGGPAINATPRQMMVQGVRRVLREGGAPLGHYRLTIAVPQGEELARRTFNPRLGVVGGISIIGTSGIVKPFSQAAFVDSIRRSMQVACATGSEWVVINSGAKSERFLRAHFPHLPLQAFVHYGNFIGETVQIAAELGVRQLVLGLMMGKAVKLAEGHLDTHSKHTVMNKAFVQQVAREAGCSEATLQAVSGVTLARELWLLPKDEVRRLAEAIRQRCYQQCVPLLPQGSLQVLLLSEEGEIYGDG